MAGVIRSEDFRTQSWYGGPGTFRDYRLCHLPTGLHWDARGRVGFTSVQKMRQLVAAETIPIPGNSRSGRVQPRHKSGRKKGYSHVQRAGMMTPKETAMHLNLTDQERQELEQGNPIRVTESKSRHDYVVVKAELFERMKKLLETETVDPSLYEFEETDQH
jgi:hypothetical protein